MFNLVARMQLFSTHACLHRGSSEPLHGESNYANRTLNDNHVRYDKMGAIVYVRLSMVRTSALTAMGGSVRLKASPAMRRAAKYR